MTTTHTADVAAHPPARNWNRGLLVKIGAAIAAFAVLVAAGLWWANTSMVPNSEYDATSAELASANQRILGLEQESESMAAALSDVEALNESLSEELATAEAAAAESSRLEARSAALTERLARQRQLAEVYAYTTVNWNADDALWASDNGVNIALADEVLGELGETGDFLGWTDGNQSWYSLNNAVHFADDPELTELWIAASETSSDYLNEVPMIGFQWRLAQLLLGRSDPAGADHADMTGP